MVIRHSFYLLPLLFITCAIGCSRAEPPLITQAEFDQIQPGMTLEEVEAIVGGKPNSLGYTENDSGEQISTTYSFINEDSSNGAVYFKNGRVLAEDYKFATELP